MIWRDVLKAVVAELRRREANAADNQMVKCGVETAEVATARAQAYRWIADELEILSKEHSIVALAKLRKWKAGKP